MTYAVAEVFSPEDITSGKALTVLFGTSNCKYRSFRAMMSLESGIASTSMTPLERENHTILDGSRRRRIASGSGTAVQDINSLIKKFLQMKKMSKNMGSFKKNPKNILNFS